MPNTGYFPLRTPYTPYTAFASKGNPFESQQQPTSHLLDETDNPLAALYNTILKFVDRDLKKIMELADKVSVVKKTSKASTLLQDMPDGPKERPKDGQGFEILANVVWTEVGRAIMDELGSTVFAAGKPDEFRKVSCASSFVDVRLRDLCLFWYRTTKPRKPFCERCSILHRLLTPCKL